MPLKRGRLFGTIKAGLAKDMAMSRGVDMLLRNSIVQNLRKKFEVWTAASERTKEEHFFVARVTEWLIENVAHPELYRFAYVGQNADGTPLMYHFPVCDGFPDVGSTNRMAALVETFAGERVRVDAKPTADASIPERFSDGILTVERVWSDSRSFITRLFFPREKKRTTVGEIRIYLSGGEDPDILQLFMHDGHIAPNDDRVDVATFRGRFSAT